MLLALLLLFQLHLLSSERRIQFQQQQSHQLFSCIRVLFFLCFSREKMDQTRIYPDFFKVFLPEISSKKLLIPNAFIACLNKMLPGKAILRNRLGSLWQVKVVCTENAVFFTNGWENFVKDNSLSFGDFLVFRYNGDCIFRFTIYEKSGCKKEDARASQSIGKQFSDAEEEGKEGKEHDCKDDDNGNNNKKGHKEEEEEDEEPKPRANMKLVGGKANPCGRGRKKKDEEEQPAQATERAINSPLMHMPAHPSFTAIIQTRNIVHNHMHVPVDFARICKLPDTKFIKLRVSDEKDWCVRCRQYANNTRLSQGWAAFVRDNDLKVGDTCNFERIQSADIVLKVTISRC